MKITFIMFGLVLSGISLVSCNRNTITEIESNDKPSEATPIDVDRDIFGYLSTASDLDYYVIEIAEPLRFEVSLSAVKGVNHAIEIHDNKELLKLVDDNRKSSPEFISNMWFDRGKYYICVKHGDRDEYKGNGDNPYTLRIKLVEQSLSQEKEPNDTSLQANRIEIDSQLTGYYSPSMNKHNNNAAHPNREEDWFTFEISNTDGLLNVYDFELSGVKGVKSEICIYNNSMSPMFSTECNQKGEPIKISGHVLENGNYYICISAMNFESNPAKSYTISVKSRISDAVYEKEPNNSINNANSISSELIKGSIFSSSDHDFYMIANTEKLQLHSEIKFDSVVTGVLKVYNDKEILLSEIKGKNSVFVIPSVMLNGNAYIEIFSEDSKSKAEKEYELSVSRMTHSQNEEEEPNNYKESAQIIRTLDLIGYINFKKDKDWYKVETTERQKKHFVISGINDAVLNISITDPEGFILQTKKIKGNTPVIINETIDKTGYLIIESIKENYIDPYTVRIED